MRPSYAEFTFSLKCNQDALNNALDKIYDNVDAIRTCAYSIDGKPTGIVCGIKGISKEDYKSLVKDLCSRGVRPKTRFRMPD